MTAFVLGGKSPLIIKKINQWTTKIQPQFNLKLFSITSLYLSWLLELSFLITTNRKCLYLEVIHFPQTLFLPPFTTFSWAYLTACSWASYNSYFHNELDSTVLVLYSLQKHFHLLFFKPILKGILLQSTYFRTPILQTEAERSNIAQEQTEQMVNFESNISL